MSSRDFLQFCYVTNDFERAIEQVRNTHRMGAFKEMRELRLPTGPDREMVGHFGLAFKNGVQFEIIQPLEGDTAIYADCCEGDGYQMHFHHLGHYIEDLDTYKQTLSEMKGRWPVPIDMAGFGGFFAYADARRDLNHFVEIFCFPADSPAIDAPRY